MRSFLLFAFICIFSSLGYSQLLSFGVKGGIPLTDPLSTGVSNTDFTQHSVRRYVVGATGELHLPFRLSVEVDALYRRLSYDQYSKTFFPYGAPISKTGNDWQFPFLAKYEFAKKPFVRPFVDAGVTFRHVSFSNQSIANPNTAGITVGGGLTLKFLILRLSPEIRYTHFPTEIFGINFKSVQSTSNQADFLVGFTF